MQPGIIKMYLGEKPYKCVQCSSKFAQLIQLNRHNKKLHNKDGLVCYCLFELLLGHFLKINGLYLISKL